MMGAHLLVPLAVLATWNSWLWFASRAAAAPEETMALGFTVLLFGGLAVPVLVRGRSLAEVPLGPVTALIALHAAAEAVAPPIFRAAIAVTALFYILFRAVFQSRPPAAFWGLVLLSMPVLPSLQFVLGYPMRIVSAVLTVAMLRLQGVPILRDGTYVTVGGETHQFDAPCSGVSMLWALVLLTLMVGVVQKMPPAKLFAALMLTGLMAIGCNVLRVSSLLYASAILEDQAPGWLHDGIGLVAFALTAGLMAVALRAGPGPRVREGA